MMNPIWTLRFMICCMAPLGILGVQFDPKDSSRNLGVLENPKSSNGQYWLVFIHGGLWQARSMDDFLPAVDNMLSSTDFPIGAIRGFAAMNYRLSGRQQSVQHPDHLLDVRSALGSLAQKMQLNNTNYILIGHSAGATLAMQVLMGEAALNGQPAQDFPLPAAVIGLGGIYDLNGYFDEVERPELKNTITNAFTSDRAAWDIASPAKFKGSFKDTTKKILIAHSRQDKDVNFAQLTRMQTKLYQDSSSAIIVDTIKGGHFQLDTQIPTLVKQVVKELDA